MKEIRLANRIIGEKTPVFIIAEAGVNHNGKVELAKELIDIAAQSGADAVKFQAFKAENIVTEKAEKAAYQKKGTAYNEKSQFSMLKQLELSKKDFTKLCDYAHKKKIIFLATPFDKESVDLLDDLNLPAIKISSGEITNLPFIRYIAEKKKPIILSTGISTIDEIEDALNVIHQSGNDNLILLHCVTSYPAEKCEMNLRTIKTLKEHFEHPVGISDHTLGIIIPIAAVALGAVVVEKHFTLDRTMQGPDQKMSLEPDELAEMVKSIREVEEALGDGIKKPTRAEKEIKVAVRRSIVAKVEINKGDIITERMLDFKRPANGLEPKFSNKIIGLRAKKRIKPDELITFDNLVKEP